VVNPLIVDHLGLTNLDDVAWFESNIAGRKVVDGCSGFGTQIKQVKATIIGAKLDVVA